MYSVEAAELFEAPAPSVVEWPQPGDVDGSSAFPARLRIYRVLTNASGSERIVSLMYSTLQYPEYTYGFGWLS